MRCVQFGSPPRFLTANSNFIGDTVFPGMVTDSGELVVVAVQRGGEALVGNTTLRAGDVMLLRGTWEALDANTVDPNVVVVDTPQNVRRQAVAMGPRAKAAIVIRAKRRKDDAAEDREALTDEYLGALVCAPRATHVREEAA